MFIDFEVSIPISPSANMRPQIEICLLGLVQFFFAFAILISACALWRSIRSSNVVSKLSPLIFYWNVSFSQSSFKCLASHAKARPQSHWCSGKLSHTSIDILLGNSPLARLVYAASLEISYQITQIYRGTVASLAKSETKWRKFLRSSTRMAPDASARSCLFYSRCVHINFDRYGQFRLVAQGGRSSARLTSISLWVGNNWRYTDVSFCSENWLHSGTRGNPRSADCLRIFRNKTMESKIYNDI